MGLLDAIFPNDDASGLLGFLKRNAALQQMPTGLPSDTAQYDAPPMAGPSPVIASAPLAPPVASASAQMPPPAPIPQQPPPVITAPAAAPSVVPSVPAASPGFMTGYENFKNGGGLIGSLVAGITGQRNDKVGQAQQQQAATANMTAKALIAKGVPEQTAIAAVQPGNGDMLKTLLTQAYGPKTVENLGNGYVYHPDTGKTTREYEPESKKSFVKFKDAQGNEIPGIFDPDANDGKGAFTPVTAPTANNGDGLPGDSTKAGAEYIATLPAAQRETVKGMLDGTIQPPTSFAMSKPYWQTLIAAAKHADPGFDENNWTARHKMSADIASSGNSSMGGILSNGKSAFGHLAELSDSMADLGNASHGGPAGGPLAHAQNYVTNSLLPSSGTQAKIKAINDNLGHYGQESTKFYSGTGGGVEERMNALKEMNPNTTSSEEMAAYLGKEKDLMLQRFREKEDQIRKTMGDGYLQTHPVFTPQLQQTIDRIDANILKLRGQTAPAPASSLPPGWTVQVH